MHVVVTGVAGFIGSHLVELLIESGHRVTGLDSFDDYLYPAAVKRETAAALEARASTRFRLIEGDICDPAAVARAIVPGVDVVCHLAALAGVRPSLAEPLRYLRTNIVGTGVVIERMRELGLLRLVFASSSSVYGARTGVDLREVTAFDEEDACLTPASPYAATKRMNELQLSTYRDLFGLGVLALRFFTVYGPRQRPDMAISKFLSAIADDRPILQFGDGSTRRDYTFIDDIVSGVGAAIERVVPTQYDLINLGGTQTISLADLVQTVERVTGKQAQVQVQPAQPGDVPVTYANIARARRLLDYDPTTRVEDGIARQWAWMQASRAQRSG